MVENTLKIYIGETDKYNHKLIYDSIFKMLRKEGLESKKQSVLDCFLYLYYSLLYGLPSAAGNSTLFLKIHIINKTEIKGNINKN